MFALSPLSPPRLFRDLAQHVRDTKSRSMEGIKARVFFQPANHSNTSVMTSCTLSSYVCLSFHPFSPAFFPFLCHFFPPDKCLSSQTWIKHSHLSLFFPPLRSYCSFFHPGCVFKPWYQINTRRKKGPPWKVGEHPPPPPNNTNRTCWTGTPRKTVVRKSLPRRLRMSDFKRHLFLLWNIIKYFWRSCEGCLRGKGTHGTPWASFKCQPGTQRAAVGKGGKRKRK